MIPISSSNLYSNYNTPSEYPQTSVPPLLDDDMVETSESSSSVEPQSKRHNRGEAPSSNTVIHSIPLDLSLIHI